MQPEISFSSLCDVINNHQIINHRDVTKQFYPRLTPSNASWRHTLIMTSHHVMASLSSTSFFISLSSSVSISFFVTSRYWAWCVGISFLLKNPQHLKRTMRMIKKRIPANMETIIIHSCTDWSYFCSTHVEACWFVMCYVVIGWKLKKEQLKSIYLSLIGWKFFLNCWYLWRVFFKKRCFLYCVIVVFGWKFKKLAMSRLKKKVFQIFFDRLKIKDSITFLFFRLP